MVYLVRKKKKGKVYLYLEQSVWRNGKSVRLWQKYLGPEKRIKDLTISLSPKKLEYQTIEFGGSAILLKIAERIKLVEIINRHTSKTRNQGLSVGEYLLINIINRCLAPSSKTRLSDWFQQDYLSNILDTVASETLNAQTYWNHFQYLTVENLEHIEHDLTKIIIDEFQLDLDCLLFDPTNFYTYIQDHDEEQLAQYGHSKENRKDLRIVNLSLLCTSDAAIPLFHKTYEGNTQDAKHFKNVIHIIFERFQALNKSLKEITLIFDKGNHSQTAFDGISENEIGFIASLRPSTQKDLIRLPLDQFTSISLPMNGKEVRYFKTTREIYGVERTLYVLHDARKRKKRQILFEQKLDEKLDVINTFIQTKLNVKKWRSIEATKTKLKNMIGKRPFRDIIQVDVSGEHAHLQVAVSIDNQAKATHIQTLGRSIIFTNRDEWPAQQVIDAFRHQYLIEDIFKHLKDPTIIAIRPMYHWTDTCIRVHIFCCVIGFLLLSLIRHDLQQDNNNKVSYRQILGAFSDLKVTKISYTPQKSPIVKLNNIDGLAEQMLQTYDLEEFLP